MLLTLFALFISLAFVLGARADEQDLPGVATFIYDMGDPVTLQTYTETINYQDSTGATVAQSVSQYLTFATVKDSTGAVVGTYYTLGNVFVDDKITGDSSNYSDSALTADSSGTLTDSSGRTWTAGAQASFPAVTSPAISGYKASPATVPALTISAGDASPKATNVIYSQIPAVPNFLLPFTGGAGLWRMLAIIGSLFLIILLLLYRRKR